MSPSLVLLPGMDGTGVLFRPLLEALDSSLNAIVVSYPSKEPLGYAELAMLVRKSLPTDRPYVLLGESFSGPIAITLAAERPRGLVGLILCATFVRAPMPWLRPLEPLLNVLPVRTIVRVAGPNRLFGRGATPELRKLFFEADQRVSTPVLRERIREAIAVDVSPLVDSVGVPVMYIQATQDVLLPRAVAERFSRASPRATVIRIQAPHAVLQCAPREAARIVADFVHGVS